MERPKTECMYCGLFWQDHTIRENYGCMAFVRLDSLVAQRGKAVPLFHEVVVCPVCDKTSDEHGDLEPCQAKWRKREQGSTGLKLQCDWSWASVTNEEPDPVKSAQMLEPWMQSLCPCGKARGDIHGTK